jgi:hypothetical protein
MVSVFGIADAIFSAKGNNATLNWFDTVLDQSGH